MQPASRVVGVGASAGGIDALQRLLPQLGELRGVAAVVVQHVHPHTRVLPTTIFRAPDGVTLTEAEEKNALMERHVYFAPPGYHLLVERDGTFSLSVDNHVSYARPSIDVLFECLARVYGTRCCAVLLTGANRDGADGCARVKQHGGRVIVQDPKDAEVDMMPRAALECCRPDYVAPLHDIGDLVRQFAEEIV
jgi:two-component system, chemotaxis family, protein-glutamate methylesterase/glutaminase